MNRAQRAYLIGLLLGTFFGIVGMFLSMKAQAYQGVHLAIYSLETPTEHWLFGTMPCEGKPDLRKGHVLGREGSFYVLGRDFCYIEYRDKFMVVELDGTMKEFNRQELKDLRKFI